MSVGCDRGSVVFEIGQSELDAPPVPVVSWPVLFGLIA